MGFPSLQRLVRELASSGVGFAVVQTAFEEHEENTPDRLRATQRQYGLAIPFGHDGEAGGDHPATMVDYHTGGTPWFVVIDPAGKILHSHFHIDAERAIAVMRSKA